MKKIGLISLLLVSLFVSACSQGSGEKHIDFNSLESNQYTQEKNTNELGSFNLLTPGFDSIHEVNPTFTWEASANATTYTLEICEDIDFIDDIEYIEYYKQSNLTTTSIKIQSELRNKNVDYYWRVTAYNDGTASKMCEKVFSFYLKAPEIEEASFDLGEADDWLLHPSGSYADVNIDRSNFFGNNKTSLAITFKKEDTNQGIPSSDGWIVVTRTVEKNIYGTDSLMFNMFYAGHDSVIKIRLVDKDNEYWYHQISVSNNAKQTVFLRFQDFIQRLNDVPVGNRHFDYERIKYMEVVFEKTFGDGAFLISDVKAVKFANYKDRFIDKLHFNEYKDSQWTYENYDFNRVIDGDELTLNYTSSISGYGFSKLAVSKNFAFGDSIKISVKYTGAKGTNIILRVYEEDLDRWAYKIPFSNLTTEDTYFTYTIPFKAFNKSEIQGDGKRQFAYIVNLQFGLEGVYSKAGSISFKDFEIVYCPQDQRVREVNEDGLIDNFSSYTSSTELYYAWDVTDVNKNEYMTLETEHAIGKDKKCVKFDYKADMEEALYMLQTDVGNYAFNALNLRLKDYSVKGKPTKVDIFIQLATGEQYVYCIESLLSYWNEYNIPFANFKLYNTTAGMDITCEAIVGIGIGLQYFNTGSPLYTNDNSIFVDDIKLVDNPNLQIKEVEKVIRPDGNFATVDNFEGYADTTDLLSQWFPASSRGYESLTLSNDVSSEGGSHSAQMQYKTNSDSISYALTTTVDSSVAAKGINIDIKGDNKVTIYINIYVLIGTSTLQYRYTITGAANVWKSYTIGFSNFSEITTTGKSLLSSMVPNITKVTFGAVYWTSPAELSNFYVDNYKFNNEISYATKTERVI